MSIHNSTSISGKITASINDRHFLQLRHYHAGGGFDGHNISLPNVPFENIIIAAAAINGDWDEVRKLLPEAVKTEDAA